MKFKTKTRRFKTKFCLPFPMGICEQYAKEVIESIETDELLVFDPKDEKGLDDIFTDDGALLIHEKAKIPVKVREWLPVGCQCIRYGVHEEVEKNALAHYRSNSSQVLWPAYAEHKPEGPAAFVGEIVISPHHLVIPNLDKPFFKDMFKCVVAHELVHVFEYLRFVAPAFMNWRSFWHTFLSGGLDCEQLCRHLQDSNTFVDRYGTRIELSCLQDYWPSQAKKWFNAFRRDTKKKQEKKKEHRQKR